MQNQKMSQLYARLKDNENAVNEKVNRKTFLEENKKKKSEQLDKVLGEKQNAMVAKELLDKSSQTAREKGRDILERYATYVVQSVFGENYAIEIALDTKAGNPVADVYVLKNIGGVKQRINLENEGGGIQQIIALAFFIAVNKLVGTDNAALVTIDEPTSAVSDGLAEDTANAIVSLIRRLDKQSIIVSHEREYLPMLIDKTYYVSSGVDGVAKVEEL